MLWRIILSLIFQIEAADIGRIQKIRIGHDGTGMFSGWYLEKVGCLKNY